jgi:hypothetical protein|tara:strand:- start:15826 stop:16563 length:738 start_codon:yes stop_codon:yes gene_type:complete
MNEPKIIHAISGPRNISTALMYSFAQRPNCVVIDEPFYASFLKRTGLKHPGREETLNSYPNSPDGAIERIHEFLCSSGTQEIYLKNMAQHMIDVPWQWASNAVHIFWIRHPRKVIRSFAKVLPDLTISDIGIVEQIDQWRSIQNLPGRKIIVDSDEMLSAPNKTFPSICDALGIPFYPEMLSWPRGEKVYDGTWWPHWYSNVHKTAAFGKGTELGPSLSPKYSDIEIKAIPFYNELYRDRIIFKR